MRTVSTKLSNKDFERFQEMCNHDGQCMSEGIRDLLKMGIIAYEESLELEESETVESVPEKHSPITYGKVLDDDGNVIGTF